MKPGQLIKANIEGVFFSGIVHQCPNEEIAKKIEGKTIVHLNEQYPGKSIELPEDWSFLFDVDTSIRKTTRNARWVVIPTDIEQ